MEHGVRVRVSHACVITVVVQFAARERRDHLAVHPHLVSPGLDGVYGVSQDERHPMRGIAGDGRRRPFAVPVVFRAVKNGFAARIVDVDTKEQADALKGVQLYALRDDLPSLPDDEFYHADLIGLEVFDTGGTLLGRVKAVQNYGADDLLEHTSGSLCSLRIC